MAGSRNCRSRLAHLADVVLAVLVACTVPAAPALAADCGDARIQPTRDSLGQARESVLCLINRERAGRGLAALRSSAALASAAASHSGDMVSRRYFQHVSNGRTPERRVMATGFIKPRAAWRVGENLAWGTGSMSTPTSVVSRWMASPRHRANMLNPGFDQAGLGVVVGIPFSQPLPGATYTLVLGAH